VIVEEEMLKLTRYGSSTERTSCTYENFGLTQFTMLMAKEQKEIVQNHYRKEKP